MCFHERIETKDIYAVALNTLLQSFTKSAGGGTPSAVKRQELSGLSAGSR